LYNDGNNARQLSITEKCLFNMEKTAREELIAAKGVNPLISEKNTTAKSKTFWFMKYRMKAEEE
jgi:hypothetical protein